MDRLTPAYLTRQQLLAFLGNDPQLIRAFETFVEALTTTVPDELADLQLAVATITALQETLANQAEQDRRDTEAARMLALSAQVDQLREHVAALSQSLDVHTVEGQLAQLREQIAAFSMKPKQVRYGSITLSAGTSGTFTFSPAASALSELVPLGVNVPDPATPYAAAQVALEISGSTVTARRGTTGGGYTVTVNFQLTEY
jgi:hypothetical protein